MPFNSAWTPARKRGWRKASHPSGIETRRASASADTDSATWRRSAARNRSERARYSTIIDKPSKAPPRLAIARATTPQSTIAATSVGRKARASSRRRRTIAPTIVKKPAPAMQRADGGWPSSDRPAAIPVRIRRPIRSPSMSANRAARAASPGPRRNPAPTTRSSASALAYAQAPRTAVAGSASPGSSRFGAIDSHPMPTSAKIAIPVRTAFRPRATASPDSDGRRSSRRSLATAPGALVTGRRGSAQETLLLQVLHGDGSGLLALDRDLGVQHLELVQGQGREHPSERLADHRVFFEHGRPHDRSRLIDDLRALRVLHHDEVEGGDRPVGAVDHRRIDPAQLLGGGPHGHGGVAAREDDDLIPRQREAIALLESRQGRRALHELGRAGELDDSAPLRDLRKVVHGGKALPAGEIAAHGDQPGGVRRRPVEPDELVRRLVESLDEIVAGLRLLPGRIVLLVEEEGSVAGVFGIEVDLAGDERRAHDLGRPELKPVLDRNAGLLERDQDHVAEERAFGIDLRRDHHLVAALGGRRKARARERQRRHAQGAETTEKSIADHRLTPLLHRRPPARAGLIRPPELRSWRHPGEARSSALRMYTSGPGRCGKTSAPAQFRRRRAPFGWRTP